MVIPTSVPNNDEYVEERVSPASHTLRAYIAKNAFGTPASIILHVACKIKIHLTIVEAGDTSNSLWSAEGRGSQWLISHSGEVSCPSAVKMSSVPFTD